MPSQFKNNTASYMGKKTCLKRKTVSHTSYFKCCITLNICLCSCLLGEAYFNTVLCLLFPISSSHAIWVIARSSYLHEHPAKQKASCVLQELAACICFSSYKGICVPHSLMKLRKSRARHAASSPAPIQHASGSNLQTEKKEAPHLLGPSLHLPYSTLTKHLHFPMCLLK